ncbi:MAG TPA: hypothetical protein VGF11_00105, partial [Acidimicrobiales bacterium]
MAGRLFCFRSVDRAGAADQIARLETLIDSCGDPATLRLRDLACAVAQWGAALPRSNGNDSLAGSRAADPNDSLAGSRDADRAPVHVALVADDVDDLRTKLQQA